MKEYKKPASLNVARSKLESAKGGTGFAEGFAAGIKGGYDSKLNTPVKRIAVVRSN